MLPLTTAETNDPQPAPQECCGGCRHAGTGRCRGAGGHGHRHAADNDPRHERADQGPRDRATDTTA